ncbi:hypothetical protein BJ322DRAFT_1068445 [Thelephora terrestris]|uniref:Uncharacterized protein n=1 Tax=Thelephora terrestris TaxID=56493 RepID=A0A9P6HC49_9AGAM|nr:hypothetical protein BJ322DRAFT_1068445 [Thelephora terrestris]
MADAEQPVDLGVRSDALEQIFRRVEEESERRAFVEEMAETFARRQASPLPSGTIVPIFQQPMDGNDANASTLKSEKFRRRASLSVSRFGQIPENSVDVTPSQTGITRSASAVSSLALKSPLYAQPPAPSVDSFGSEGEVHEVGLVDDHVTQMRHISGKPSISKAVGGMISRTISTRRSKSNLKVVSSQNLFIGVSVTEHEEASELENEPEAAKKLVVTSATVHAPLKKQPSKRDVGSPDPEEQDDWINRARKFGRKIRRKSQAWLSGQGPKAVASASPPTTATN